MRPCSKPPRKPPRGQRWPVLFLLALAASGCGSTPLKALPTTEALGESSAARADWTVGFLAVDGVYNTELMAPYDVLEHAVHHLPDASSIEVFTVSPDGVPITTAEGLLIQPHHSFATAPPIDILVVPSARGSRDADLENEALIEWVRSTGSDARYVVSLCWGAFVLAEAGLLDGHASTTFPADYERFARTFPQLDVRFNVSFVHDRGRLTSQGGVRSYEVAMYLVDLLFGEEVAAGVGRGLLIPWPPAPGEHPPFLARPASQTAVD